MKKAQKVLVSAVIRGWFKRTQRMKTFVRKVKLNFLQQVIDSWSAWSDSKARQNKTK